MSRQVLIALGAGALSAAIAMTFLSGSAGDLLFVYLAPLPLFMVGLGLGTAAGTVASAGGLVMAGLLGGVLAAVLYGLIHALPAWLAIRQSLLHRQAPDGSVAWYPAGYVLSSVTALGAALFAATALAVWSSGGAMMSTISAHLEAAFQAMLPNITADDRAGVVQSLISYFPGAAGALWVVMATANGLVAQAVLKRMGRNLRPSPSLADLALPDWISWLIVGAAVVALFGPGELTYMGRNMVTIFAVPFFFLGLAVVHALARRLAFPGTFLAAFYLIMVISGMVAMAVAGAGLIEQWFGLRRRFALGDADEEEE